MSNLLKSARALFTLLLIVVGVTFVDREVHIAELPQNAIKAAKAVDPRQLLCLAENIFYEAGSESLIGQAAVARVVLNRIHYGFASTPCAVVHQKTQVVDANTGDERVICQFSWTCEDVNPINRNDPRFKRSKEIAYQVLAYDAYSEILPRSTLFFHNTSVNPQWRYYRVGQIGNHIFYSKKKVKHNVNQQWSQGS